MTKEDLSSDRINYLIWRYLQESDYRETALKLQKEWHVEDPQVFDFAPHVRENTLVAVLHRGLLYNDSERKSIEARRGATTPLRGFFGPLTPLSPAPGVDGDDYENVRKREADPRQPRVRMGSPAKRIKLSNGLENGINSTMPMDIDEVPNGNGHAYPSPKEVEPATTLIVATDGPEKSTQVEKVAELGSETVYLTLSDSSSPEVKPLVLFCAWNPRDPTVLAGAGTDKLARLWTISRGTGAEPYGHVNGSATPYQDLFDRNSNNASHSDINSTITALSWTSDGAAIALASESEDGYGPSGESARVSMLGADGTLIEEHTGFEPPILCLQWNPSNMALLALIPQGISTVVTIFSPSTQMAMYLLPEPTQEIQPLDALWISDQEFLVYGGDLLVTFTWLDGTINQTRKFETREDHQLAKATYDRHSRLLATASDAGIIDIWDHLGQCHSRIAHRGQIISLLWQPLPNHFDFDGKSERFLASAGEDGIISIWSARPESKPRCSMTLDGAVVSLAFTPDGAFLASATTEQILIWKLEDVSVPRARWVLGPGYNRRERNCSLWATDEGHYTLSWDANGQKLAYGVNNNLAVIEWRPNIYGIGH